MDTKPEILCHPHIPKPLHGINPRTINGKAWWDRIRQKVYQKYDYHCLGCGIHKSNAKGYKWLEAHEFWKIDLETGICRVNTIEPLCHYCHNFIHSGRLSMIINKEKSIQEVKDILEHGLMILSENNLKAYPFTLAFANLLKVNTFNVMPQELPKENISWSEWKLIYNNKEYKSKFSNIKEWQNHYSKK